MGEIKLRKSKKKRKTYKKRYRQSVKRTHNKYSKKRSRSRIRSRNMKIKLKDGRTKKYKQKGGSKVVGGLLGAAAGGIGSYLGDLDPGLAVATTLASGTAGVALGHGFKKRKEEQGGKEGVGQLVQDVGYDRASRESLTASSYAAHADTEPEVDLTATSNAPTSNAETVDVDLAATVGAPISNAATTDVDLAATVDAVNLETIPKRDDASFDIELSETTNSPLLEHRVLSSSLLQTKRKVSGVTNPRNDDDGDDIGGLEHREISEEERRKRSRDHVRQGAEQRSNERKERQRVRAQRDQEKEDLFKDITGLRKGTKNKMSNIVLKGYKEELMKMYEEFRDPKKYPYLQRDGITRPFTRDELVQLMVKAPPARKTGLPNKDYLQSALKSEGMNARRFLPG